jgi:hypothetical protein
MANETPTDLSWEQDRKYERRISIILNVEPKEQDEVKKVPHLLFSLIKKSGTRDKVSL